MAKHIIPTAEDRTPYDVERRIYLDDDGNERLSHYWRLVCRVCGWRGKRISKPGSRQSKQRMTEWEAHVANDH